MSEDNGNALTAPMGGLPTMHTPEADILARYVDSGETFEQFLRFAKGDWMYGAEATPVEPNSWWEVFVGTISRGYICWGDDNKPLGEVMANIAEPQVNITALPNYDGRDWTEQHACTMACLTGSAKGTLVRFNTSSRGGRDAMRKLVNEVRQRQAAGHLDLVPIVRLGVDSYQHKSYGKIYKPTLEIVKWANHATDTLTSLGEEHDAAEAKPEEDGWSEPKPARPRPRR